MFLFMYDICITKSVMLLDIVSIWHMTHITYLIENECMSSNYDKRAAKLRWLLLQLHPTNPRWAAQQFCCCLLQGQSRVKLRTHCHIGTLSHTCTVYYGVSILTMFFSKNNDKQWWGCCVALIFELWIPIFSRTIWILSSATYWNWR